MSFDTIGSLKIKADQRILHHNAGSAKNSGYDLIFLQVRDNLIKQRLCNYGKQVCQPHIFNFIVKLMEELHDNQTFGRGFLSVRG